MTVTSVVVKRTAFAFVMLTIVATLASACGGHSGKTAIAPGVTAASFKAQVLTLYAPLDKSPIPHDFAVGAANYDGFADAVAALQAPASETADKGAVVSAGRAAAATLRKYSSILDVPESASLDSLFALQRLVHGLPT